MEPLGRQKRRRKKTSTSVIAHPATRGMAPWESKFSAIAEPTTYLTISIIQYACCPCHTDLRNIRSNDCCFGEHIEYIDQPAWEVLTAILCQVETSHRTQLDAQRLQKDCENVGQEDDEQQGVLELRTALDAGGVVARVDIGDRDEKAWADEARKLGQTAGTVQSRRHEKGFERTAR